MAGEYSINKHNDLIQYIIHKDSNFIDDDLNILQNLFIDIAAVINKQLRLYCDSDHLHIQIKSLDNFKACDFSSFVKKSTLIVKLWAESWNSNIFLILDADLVYFATDIFFGNPEPQIKYKREYLFSSVEMKIAEVIALSVTNALNNILAKEQSKILEIISMTSADNCNYEEVLIPVFSCCTFRIHYKQLGVDLPIILPRSCHRQIQEKVARTVHVPVTNCDPLWTQHMQYKVNNTHITIEAFISQGQVTLRELSKLFIGQILALPINATHQVYLRSGRKSLYKCSLGKIGNSFSVSVTDTVD